MPDRARPRRRRACAPEARDAPACLLALRQLPAKPERIAGRAPVQLAAMSQSSGSNPSLKPRSRDKARMSDARGPCPSPRGSGVRAMRRSVSCSPSGDLPKTCSPSRTKLPAPCPGRGRAHFSSWCGSPCRRRSCRQSPNAAPRRDLLEGVGHIESVRAAFQHARPGDQGERQRVAEPRLANGDNRIGFDGHGRTMDIGGSRVNGLGMSASRSLHRRERRGL